VLLISVCQVFFNKGKLQYKNAFVRQGRGVADCTYFQRLDFFSLYLPGCRHTCRTTSTVALCCPGYWGPDCNGQYQFFLFFALCFATRSICSVCEFVLRIVSAVKHTISQYGTEKIFVSCTECPGGAEAPCSAHGQCHDGLYGNGSCTCAVI